MTAINGYQIVTPFKQVGAGQCEWAQAEKGGKKYFIKRFLRPTLLTMGSEETKALSRRQCQEFERRHTDMRRRLDAVSAGDGNLVTTRDFFRDGSKYYKVTDWVDTPADPVGVVRKMSKMDRFVVALTAVHCVQGLHQAGIVHGDLKPANILIMKTRASWASRLIDFDDSYPAGEPPEELVGTPDYYAPEVFRYIKGKGDAATLAAPADIFALGIILCEYFAGRRPKATGKGKHPDTIAEAVIAGLRLDTGLDGDLDTLVRTMLELDPDKRPTCFDVIQDLQALKAGRSIRSMRKGDTPPLPPLASTDSAGITITTTMKTPGAPVATAASGTAPAPEPAVEDTGVAITGRIPGLFDEPVVQITGSLLKT
jgi:serine/threonine protein kinase